jgi:hypothetical protein
MRSRTRRNGASKNLFLCAVSAPPRLRVEITPSTRTRLPAASIQRISEVLAKSCLLSISRFTVTNPKIYFPINFNNLAPLPSSNCTESCYLPIRKSKYRSSLDIDLKGWPSCHLSSLRTPLRRIASNERKTQTPWPPNLRLTPTAKTPKPPPAPKPPKVNPNLPATTSNSASSPSITASSPKNRRITKTSPPSFGPPSPPPTPSKKSPPPNSSATRGVSAAAP